MKSISDLGDLRGKRVLIRCDLNVPLDGDQITDDGRIRASLPTLNALREAGAKVIVLAHLGRPKGEVNPKYSLAPAAKRLGELLGTEVKLASDVVGDGALEVTDGLADGEVAMLENVRYEPGEESKDEAERGGWPTPTLRWAMSSSPTASGWSIASRPRSSTWRSDCRARPVPGPGRGRGAEAADRGAAATVRGRPRWGQGLRQAGRDREPDQDGRHLGGRRRDGLHLLAAQGFGVGKSLLEADQIDAVKGYLDDAAAGGTQIVLPSDIVVAPEFKEDSPPTVVAANAIPDDQLGLDIGPESSRVFAAVVAKAKTVFWNGPMGVAEWENFAAGTKAVARALTEVEGLSVVGGGDSAAAVRDLGFADDDFGHISTGGGASLEYLEGKTLPGLAVLDENGG